jgi:aspartate 1-decarboxylase
MRPRTRRMLKSKIHRATVTDANLNYEGSITIDEDLLDLADIRPYEQVFVVNINTGARFETYTIVGPRGRGDMCLNGAAARLAHTGDLVIVMSYAEYAEKDLIDYEPIVVHVDEQNRPTQQTSSPIPATLPTGWDEIR